MKLLRFLANLKFLSERRRLQLYPPFFMMRIKVLEMRDNWRHIRIRLPLNAFSRNLSGAMFGGYQACLADPIAALACARVFPGYSVWTRAMEIDFRSGGRTDLELRFEFPPDLEESIARELAERGRCTPTFEYGYYLTDGTRCTVIRNTVAIRPKGYVKATTRPVDLDEI